MPIKTLQEALGQTGYIEFRKALSRVISEHGGRDVLKVGAEVEVDVRYLVEARVSLDLRGVELDSTTALSTRVEGELADPTAITIDTQGVERMAVDNDQITDAIHEAAEYEIPHELDTYGVEIMDVMVDDYDVVEFTLDPESEQDVEDWNRKAAGEEV